MSTDRFSNPFKMTKDDWKELDKQEREGRKKIETSPQQQRIKLHKAQRKQTPSQPTLRQCVIENLSLAQMDIINARSGTVEYLDAVQQVCRFTLWRSYRNELKCMEVPAVQMCCWQAEREEGRKHQNEYRHLACMHAIFHLVRDPSVRADREALEISDVTTEASAARRSSTRL